MLNPNFISAVKIIHPNVNFITDVIIQDNSDGNGPFLVAWNLPGNPPTDVEIAAIMAKPIVPQSVPMLNARRALRAAGLLDKVNTAIATQSSDVQDAWNFSQSVYRDSPTVLALSTALALTNAQVDDLFIQAASLAPL